MAVDIADGVTAGDIVQKLQRRSRLNEDVIRKRFSSSCLEVNATPSPEEKVKNPAIMGEQFLFEVGGNIGEWSGSGRVSVSGVGWGLVEYR